MTRANNGLTKFREDMTRRTPSRAVLASIKSGDAPVVDSNAHMELAIAELWIEDQPRLIVPEDDLARLASEDRAQPAALLELLRELAPRDVEVRDTLAEIEELAANIHVHGVLTPLLVGHSGGRLVIRDGHRRALASLIADRERVPARILETSSAFSAASQQLAANLERADMTAIEQGRWLFKLARLAEEELRDELGLPNDVTVTEQWLVDELAAERSDGTLDARRRPAATKDLRGRIKERVCECSGFKKDDYYHFLRLNRLSPEARRVGHRLSERFLRPILKLPSAEQAEIIRFVVQRGLAVREEETLVNVALSGDRDQVQRVMARLAREDGPRQRTAVSWEPLLHAVPRDLNPRLAALHAELQALPEERRAPRLQTLREQRALMAEAIRSFDELLAIYGEESPST